MYHFALSRNDMYMALFTDKAHQTDSGQRMYTYTERQGSKCLLIR